MAHGHPEVTTCPRETDTACSSLKFTRAERDMSEVLEGAVCGIDGCAPSALDHFGPVFGVDATLAIEVISDAICPWCWVAKRRLDRGDRGDRAGRHGVRHLASFRAQPRDAQGRSGPTCLPLGQVRVLAALPSTRRAGRRGRTVRRACVQP